MRKICKEMRDKLVKAEKLTAFVSACEKREAEGDRADEAFDGAIDEVCPGLKRFKCRKRVGSRAKDARCNGFRMLEWIVENYGDKGVTEDDAPSGAAWSVLNAARDDGDIYRDVLKKYLDSKIKLDAAQGDTDTRKMDGQAEYDILEGLDAKEFS